MISEDEAIQLVKNTSKYSHALLVSAIMAELAKQLNEDVKLWRIVGLLHDLDYDEVREDMRKHGVAAAEKLKGRLPEEAIYAIKAHDYRTGFKPKRRLDKALIAADSAAVLMDKMEESGIELNPETFLMEIEKASKTTPWHKDNIMRCIEIGLSLNVFLQLCSTVMSRSTQH